MSDEIRIEVPEVSIPEIGVTLTTDVIAPYQLIVHSITSEVITVTTSA